MTDVTPYFIENLKTLLAQAAEQKNQEPKSEKTRYWAVVYTELEKVYAYAQAYLKSE